MSHDCYHDEEGATSISIVSKMEPKSPLQPVNPVHRGSLPTGAQTGERFSGWLGCSKNIKKILFT